MRAAMVVDGVVEVGDQPVPEPGEREARVRVHTAGVCHSDLHLARGHWDGIPTTMPLGHEAIGTVDALGPGADAFVQVGDRVILGLGGTGGGYWCGACRWCISGHPRHCPQGRGIMGTFAEHISVFAPSLVVLPDTVGDEEAPLACGGLTAYGAVKKLTTYGVLPGAPVAIVGAAGGLGHYAVQLASSFGYRVVGVDVGEQRLDFVRSLGAAHAVSPDDAPGLVRREYGGVDAALVFAASMSGYRLGFQLLGTRGLFVAVGIPPSSDGPFELTPWDLFGKDPTIIFSAVGTVQDMRELVALAAEGRVRTHVGRTGPLSDLGAIFDELEAGAYVGRAVLADLTA